ncbi:MAG: Lrp/AsnC ligand binding domain-containing protein [Nitrososphaerales archaeon]
MKAYIEVKVEAGTNIHSLLNVMRAIEGVREAFAVTGHTDIVASIEGSDLRSIADIITHRLHAIRGVASTETMVCVEE